MPKHRLPILVMAAMLAAPNAKAAAPKLRHSNVVENVAALTQVEALAEAMREYEAELPIPADGERASKLVPEGQVVCEVKSAGGYHAVVTRRETPAPAAPSLLCYDAEWRPLGEVKGLPRHDGKSDYRISLYPNPDGSRWAVLAVQTEDKGSSAALGLVRPPEMRFGRNLIQGSNGVSDVAWWGDRLIVVAYSHAAQTSSILSFDSSGKVRTLYEENAPGVGRAWIGAIAPSPDGRHLAFGRAPTRPNLEYGLWLLDTETGRCGKILWDDTGLMDCRPTRWEGPNSLLFLHTLGRGFTVKRQWHRARLRLPMEQEGSTRSQ